MLLFVSSSLQRLGARPVHACTRCARAARRVNPLSHSLAAASRSLPTSLSSCPRYRMVPIHPARIEGYDASHTAGEAAVVSRVVFNEGAPSRAEYRTTAVRPAVRNTASSQPGNDDYGSLRDALARRFRFRSMPRPDLLLIDGGKACSSQPPSRRVLPQPLRGAPPSLSWRSPRRGRSSSSRALTAPSPAEASTLPIARACFSCAPSVMRPTARSPARIAAAALPLARSTLL